MKTAAILRLLRLALGGVILFFGGPLFCQSQLGNLTPSRPPGVRVVRVEPRPSRPGWDPFDTMISSAASFDMDSPVEAHAEFDPPVASVGERVVYRVVVTALDESLELPDPLPGPSGLELTAGGRAQIYEVSPGRKLRPQTTVLFHVVPGTNGTFEMPAFDVMAYGKPVKVPATNLVVLPAGAPDAGRQAPRLTVELPQETIFVGQTVRVPLALPDTDGSVHGMSQAGITGDFIFSEPFPIATRQEGFRSGDKTVPAFVQEVTITPMRQGAQRLVAQANAIEIRPIPGQTNGAMQTHQMLIDSDPFTLNVTPLPTEGKLPGFAGAVGEFQMEPPRLSTNEVRAGEPVTLTVYLRGEGNLGRLTPPPPPTDRNWQTFPPINESAAPAGFMRAGVTTFSYPLIPLSDQVKATPPIPFSYFDPRQKAYVDLTIPSVPITVTAAAEATAQASATMDTNASPANEDANREKEPVLAGLAKSPGGTAGGLKPVQQRWWFLVFQALPAAALGGLWAWDRRRRHLEAHPEIVLKRRARRGLRRELRRARRAAAAQDAPGFVTGSINALREACAPHGAANPEALVCADVLRELASADQQGQSAEAVRRLFTAGDAMRFGRAEKNGGHLLSLQPELERLLEQLRMRL